MIFNFSFEKLIKIISIFLIAFFVNFLFQRLLKKIIGERISQEIIKEEEKKKRIDTLIDVFGGTTRLVIWMIALLTVLPELGINLSPILASLGLAGFAVGMAAKDIISDFISGLFILLEGQYFIGDKIKIAGFEGKVVEFNLRRTIIKDENGFLHSIPNSQIKIITKKSSKNVS